MHTFNRFECERTMRGQQTINTYSEDATQTMVYGITLCTGHPCLVWDDLAHADLVSFRENKTTASELPKVALDGGTCLPLYAPSINWQVCESFDVMITTLQPCCATML